MSGAIRSRLDSGRWQALFRSTYATFSGPVPRDCLLWAAVPHAGDGAAASHESAAELVGLTDQPSDLVHLRDVERAHRLPQGSRQYAVRRPGGRWYDDVRYARFGVTVELDGRAAHPDEARWRDMRRDNAAAVDGRRVLRYGWTDVAGQPCAVAAQVATVLRASGWAGPVRRCGPHCTVITETSCSQGYQNSP